METTENNSISFLRTLPNIGKWDSFSKNTTNYRKIKWDSYPKNTFWKMTHLLENNNV